MKTRFRIAAPLFFLAALLLVTGCGGAPPLAKPETMTAPKPIEGNGGKYMSPYTTDDVLAKWVDKAINVKVGAAVGKAAGAYIGRKALEQIPFVAGIIGSTVGEAAGRAIAIESAGGWEYIKKTSDLSFNSVDNMAVYLYVKHSKSEHYKNALSATFEIYPDLAKRYWPALQKASRKK